MKKILKRITEDNEEFFNGQKVMVYYNNDWFQSPIVCIEDKLCVIDPDYRVFYPGPGSSVEIYIVQNVADEEPEEGKPKIFTVNWSAKYETQLTLKPGQILDDAIGDIDPSPVDDDLTQEYTEYICDSFEVEQVKDIQNNKIVPRKSWGDIQG